ncbi:MAG: hypothetical protein HOW73_02735 [Polyangiaceae bacterium]|nr:hypothetical protein [Polyangiaceae bacterium]
MKRPAIALALLAACAPPASILDGTDGATVELTACPAGGVTTDEPIERTLPCSLRAHASGVGLFVAADAATPVANIEFYANVPVKLRDPLPFERGKAARARVELESNGFLQFQGWVALDGIDLRARRRIEIVSGHVWLRAGAVVNVLGARDSGVVVRSGDECSQDEEFEVSVQCEDLESALQPSRAPGPPDSPGFKGEQVWIKREGNKRNVLDLLATPIANGCVVQQIDLSDSSMTAVERQGDFVRVMGGRDLQFDGWAPVHELTTADPTVDRSSCCGPPDLVDRCPVETRNVRSGPEPVEVRVGADPNTSAAIGFAEAGAEVDVVDRRDGFVAVLPARRHILPARDQSFWIAESALVPASNATAHASGCP